MYDGGKILLGSSLFLATVLFPFWRSRAGTDPQVILPTGASSCLEDAATMRASHMTLLAQWRTDVVRGDRHEHVTSDGRRYEKSLTRTCMGCHQNAGQFCTRCHDYVSAYPSCFACHVAPEGRAP
jgi:hypothetical protein